MRRDFLLALITLLLRVDLFLRTLSCDRNVIMVNFEVFVVFDGLGVEVEVGVGRLFVRLLVVVIILIIVDDLLIYEVLVNVVLFVVH